MKFAYSNPDGSVAIAVAAPKEKLERVLGPLSDKEYREHVCKRLIPKDARDVIELPDDWVSPDRSKRSLWRIRDSRIVIS